LASSRFNLRTLLLIVAEALLIFFSMVTSAYLRLGWVDAYYELNERVGFLKAGVATLFCLIAFYLYDLYDFVVMHDRRELVLRLIQALGLAWVALAIVMYLVPALVIGRGVTLIALPLALALMVTWRVAAHWLLGHPKVGERILIVGSGESAVEIAREILGRRDAGYRVVGFVDSNSELVGKSLINPRVLGTTNEMAAIARREGVNRVVVALGERRGQFPVRELLDMSLSGDVAIEECASFYERLTGRVSLDMMRPSWLIFSGRGRQSRVC
jgi:FlaA1/EpsC-like NDP-sugar epimerase